MDIEKGTVNIPNIRDLLIQCVKKMVKKFDTFYKISIEEPSGKKIKVFVAQNETGKYTAMLPEDY
jgi:hypothetical protein